MWHAFMPTDYAKSKILLSRLAMQKIKFFTIVW